VSSPRPSTVRGSAAPGTSRTAHFSRAGAGSKLGGPRAALGSKPSAHRQTGLSHPSHGSANATKSSFGNAKPTEQRPRTRLPISTSLGSDFGEGQGKIGGRIQP
jgi:hypothetical protein